MKLGKEAVLKTRIDPSTAEAYVDICLSEGTTPSEQLRNFVIEQVRNHRITKGGFELQIELGEPYGRGAGSLDEYYVRATLSANSLDSVPNLVPFLLPDFTSGIYEPFRVDSFYTHRLAMPGARSDLGRLLGAKMVDGIWEGAIFLYRVEDFGSPKACFPEINDALRRNILRGLGPTLELEDVATSL